LKVLRQIIRAPRLSGGNLLRSRKDLRRVLQDISGKTRVNHSPVLDVVPGKHRYTNEDNEENNSQQGQTESGRPESFLDADTQVCSSGLKLYCLLTGNDRKAALCWRATKRFR